MIADVPSPDPTLAPVRQLVFPAAGSPRRGSAWPPRGSQRAASRPPRKGSAYRTAFHVVLIAIPILIQVYFNSGLAYGLMKLFRVPYGVAAPGALIGASNFFELAVATAIALYGPASGAALATVVGVLVEVPVMLSVCRFCVATRGWFEPAAAASDLGPVSSPEA